MYFFLVFGNLEMFLVIYLNKLDDNEKGNIEFSFNFLYLLLITTMNV